jgi:hypothetical protein
MLYIYSLFVVLLVCNKIKICRLKYSFNKVISAVAGRGWVKNDGQQHLCYFPARKINSVETNNINSVFSKGG